MNIEQENKLSFKTILLCVGVLFLLHVTTGYIFAELSSKSIIVANVNDREYILMEGVIAFIVTIVFFLIFGCIYKNNQYKEAFKVVAILLFVSIGLSGLIMGRLESILIAIDVFTTTIAMLIGIFMAKSIKR